MVGAQDGLSHRRWERRVQVHGNLGRGTQEIPWEALLEESWVNRWPHHGEDFLVCPALLGLTAQRPPSL